jgi:diguanylate cyclase (GGDEF)-like protein
METTGRDPEALLDRARSAFAETRFEDAAIYARSALEAFREHGDVLGQARSRSWYGAAQIQQSQYRQGLETLNQAIQSFTELDRPDLTGHAENYIAVMYEELGDIDQAFTHYNRALEASRALGDSELEGRILANMGDALVTKGDFESALPNLQAAAGVLELAEDASLLGWTQCAIGRVYLLQDSMDEAGEWLDRALKSAARGEGLRCEGEIFCNYGDYLGRIGRVEDGIEYLQRALDIAVKLGVRREIMRAHQSLAEAYERSGDAGRALAHHKDYHRIHAAVFDDVLKAKLRNMSAEMDLEKSELEKQMSHLKNVELAEALKTLETQKQMLERLSVRDPLTNAYNRRFLDQCLVKEFKRSRRHGTPLALAMMDADHFKRVNDEHSHSVGDHVLAMLTEITSSLVRTEDVLARFGGEEFVLLLPGTDLGGAVYACEKIRRAIEDYPWQNTGEGLSVTVSFGVATTEGADDWQEMMAAADRNLYQAKADGRNQVCPSPESTAGASEAPA